MMVSPMSRFGTVPITLLRIPGESAPDWITTLRSKTFTFPGGNRSVTQMLGQSDWRVTYLARLESESDFALVMTLLGTRQMLRIPAGATAYPGVRTFYQFGELYKEFDGILLTAVDETRIRSNGSVTCRIDLTRTVPT